MEKNYYFVNDSPPGLSLNCLNSEELKKSLSLDAFRFATHSAQTVYEAEKNTAYDKMSAWRLIETYYAAFFAAHAALRFFGRSFSFLESGHVRFLASRCCSDAGYAPSLPSTYYLIEFNPSASEVLFTQHKDSHKDLWKCFFSLILFLEQETLKSRASNQLRQELSAYFSDLSESLTNRGQFSEGAWLSNVRNEVNYKSAHGVWFPFSKSTPSFTELVTNLGDWRKGCARLGSIQNEKNELRRFFMTAHSVVDLGISLALDYRNLVNRGGPRSSEFSRLLNLSAVAHHGGMGTRTAP